MSIIYFPRCLLRVAAAFFGLALLSFVPSPTEAQGAQGLLNAGAIHELPRSPADHRISFGPDPLNIGDLRLPDGPGPFPVVVVIHGGCWVERFADLEHTSPAASALRDAGVATWNIEYRRLDQPGGGFPGTFLDVGRAADALRELARIHPLDLERVVAIGHSAGGHLAGWLAMRSRLPEDSPLYVPDPLPLTGVISLGGPLDLALFDGLDASTCGLSVVRPLLGNPDALEREALADASPAERLPLGTPQWMVAGELDRILPGEHAKSYVDRARAAGDDSRFVQVPGEGHFEVIAPGTASWTQVERAVFELLQGHHR